VSLIELNSAKQAIIKILSLEEEKKTLVIEFLWLWWNARKKANAGGDKIISIEEIVYKAHSMKYVDTLRSQREAK
jgi:hypothetical protein